MINQILTGNNVEILKQYEDETFDLVVSSPPYDSLRNYKGKVDKNTFEGGFSFPFQELAKELYRVMKKGGTIVWVVGDMVIKGSESGSSFKQALYFKEIGFNLHDTMIYQKAGCSFPEKTRYYQNFEYMFVLTKGKPKTVNLLKDKPNIWAGHTNFGTPSSRQKDGTIKQTDKFVVGDYGVRYNIWYINNGYGFSTPDKEAHDHPAIFPESLAEDHILSWSNEGDIVLDPFSGSGTTCKMAYINNRKYLGIDINEEYNEIARKRIDKYEPYTEENPNPKSEFIVRK